jgi:hypothetical protein
MAMLAVSMPLTAEPSAPVDAPSAELLEYLGSWNGDEAWLQSDEFLPPPSGASRVSRNREEQDREKPRDPAEQER